LDRVINSSRRPLLDCFSLRGIPAGSAQQVRCMVSRFNPGAGKGRVIVAGAIRIAVLGVLGMRSSLTTDANAHRTIRGSS